MEQYDLIIVGGGPAGSTLARELPPSFGRVLLLEKRKLARAPEAASKKPCSGLVAVPAQEVLARQGLMIPDAVLLPPHRLGIRAVDTGTGRQITERDIIFNVDRHAFELWLFGLIPPHIEVSDDTAFVAFEKKDGFLEVAFNSPEGRRTARTKRLVGADGANSKIRRLLPGASAIPKYTGIEWFVPLDGHTPEPFFHILLDPVLSDYYLWSLPKGDHLHVGGAFRHIDDSSKIPARLQQHLQKLGVLPHTFRTDGMWAHPISRAAGVNDLYFGDSVSVHLAGEASGLICPTSAEGYSYALGSARRLAQQLTGGQPVSQDEDRKRIAKKLFRKKLLYTSVIRQPFFYLKGKKY